MKNTLNTVEFVDGYIVNPIDFRTGSLFISPFSSDDIHINKQIWLESKLDAEPVIELDGKLLSITQSATKALELVLIDLKLKPDDEIWIVTSSGNKYISSCVTQTIEMFCKWSREKTDKTAAILVNHEFGFLYPDIDKLKAFNLPIIEDKAYSLYSYFRDNEKNYFGDYTIYSMAKMFPMQAGGMIHSKSGLIFQKGLTASASKYYKACFLYYNSNKEDIIQKRTNNFVSLQMDLLRLGFMTRFLPVPGEVPGACVFRAFNTDLQELKSFLQRQGVECSVFYGEEAFYIPCHQNMDDRHIDYIITLMKNFIK